MKLWLVAPLAGSVDRNRPFLFFDYVSRVAPLAGSVDRNPYEGVTEWKDVPSLPSRGAWIEIMRKFKITGGVVSSLPSRGAWIEITGAAT